MGTLPDGSSLLGSLTNGKQIYALAMLSGYQLWGTDGSADGAEELFAYSTTPPDPPPLFVGWGGDNAIVIARHGSDYMLYWTDGSVAGTTDVLNFAPHSLDNEVGFVTRLNGRSIVYTRDGQTNAFYSLDGTAAGTQHLFNMQTDYSPHVGVLSNDGTTATFAVWGVGGQATIFTTDGSSAATTQEFSGLLNYQGAPDVLSVAFAIFWGYAFGTLTDRMFWTGVSSDWSGPIVNFIGPDPDWHWGGFFGPMHPNWSIGIDPLSGNAVTIDYPGLLNANTSSNIFSLEVGPSSILSVSGQLNVATNIADHGAIYVSGKLQVGGAISVDSGAIFALADGNLVNATLVLQPGAAVAPITGTTTILTDVTLPDTTLVVTTGANLSLVGTITNNGTLALSPSSGTAVTTLSAYDPNVAFGPGATILGTGVITLAGGDAGLDGIYGNGHQAATIGPGQTIIGSGVIFDVINQGTIIANQPTPLSIGPVANDNAIIVTAAGSLDVQGLTNNGDVTDMGQMTGGGITNLGHTISIKGGATFTLAGGRLTGGTLSAEPGAVVQAGTSQPVLRDLTIAAGTTMAVGDGLRLYLTGAITNNGTLVMTPSTSVNRTLLLAYDAFNNNNATIDGIGVIRIAAGQAGDDAFGGGNDFSVVGSGQTIVGSGFVSGIISQGTIVADQASPLTLSIVNSGTIRVEQIGTAILQGVVNTGQVTDLGSATIYGSELLNTGGTLTVGSAATLMLANGLRGGTLLGEPGSAIEPTTSLPGVPFLADLTIASGTTVTLASETSLELHSTIVNNGLLDLRPSAGGQPTQLRVYEVFTGHGATLDGTGVIALTAGTSPFDGIWGNGTESTIGPGQTIVGSGTLVGLINHGTIIGNQTKALALDGLGNDGLVIADNGTVIVQNFTGGTLRILNGGTVTVDDASTSDETIDFAGFSNGTLVLTPQGSASGTAISGLTIGDRIELAGLTIANANVSSPGTIAVGLSGGTSFALSNVTFAPGAPTTIRTGHNPTSGNDFVEVACFAAGTHIATPRGHVSVEELRPGDYVLSHFGGQVPIEWIGRRHVHTLGRADPSTVWPIRIDAGALGPNTPAAPLRISADHAVYIDGLLIPAALLANGTTIRPEPTAEVTYFHIELPQHDVILAENLPCESYLDTGNRSAFDNAPTSFHRPDEPQDAIWCAQACAPQCRDPAVISRIRLRFDGPDFIAPHGQLYRIAPRESGPD